MSEVWFIFLDGFDLYEASSAMRAFELANDTLRQEKPSMNYEVRTFSTAATPVRSHAEPALKVNALPGDIPRRVERLVVVGGRSATQALRDLSTYQPLIAWISRQRPRIGQLASIGEDAFVVMQSAIGFARATDRSFDVEAMATLSGMELALRFITQDAGHRVAMHIAQQVAPAPERFGAPFRFRAKVTGDERVLALNRWIVLHIRESLTNERLAQHLAMSGRTFSRFYRRATGLTPARAVERIRLEHACHTAETTLRSFKEIAQRSGFSSEEVMRRAFLRVLGMSPSQYRQMFYGKV